MGTLATESYIRLVNRATHAHCDQDYLDYIVFNDSSVPDRTAYILGESDENPFPVLADDIEKATTMGASFIVLTCNTAHYFYDDFQALTTVPILHMPRGAVARMAQRYPKNRFPRVGFLGTVGSRKSGVYKRAVEEAGYTFVEPTDELQARITSLIYDDVKGSGELNLERTARIAISSSFTMKMPGRLMTATMAGGDTRRFRSSITKTLSLQGAQ